MASDEQRVRTMAGWIGVEISRSRMRTPGRPGYGLYRVRGSVGRRWHETRALPRPVRTPDMLGERGAWTAYAFTLEVIEAAVRNSIEQGRPSGPMALHLVEAGAAAKTGAGGYAGGHTVPTRWTQAYRGRRNLGEEPGPAAVGAVSERSTVRARQREANNEFQAEHLERRRYGLEQRHAAKLRLNGEGQNGTVG